MSLLVLEESVGKGRNSQVGTERAENMDLEWEGGRQRAKATALTWVFLPSF